MKSRPLELVRGWTSRAIGWAAALLCGFLAPSATAWAAAVEPGYRLVWADEFDVDGRPDPANWTYERGFVRNHEQQYYQPENAWVRDGRLVIEARREQVANADHRPGSRDWRSRPEQSTYTSACLHTRGLQAWVYGRFEMRARIPTGPGMWPAWWTLGMEREWPSNGEIDIMEYYRGRLLANVAWGTQRRWRAAWDTVSVPLAEIGGPDWANEFHVWRMEWCTDFIRLYVDDRLLNETAVDHALNPDGFSPFRQPHYMLLNVALGGDNGGPIDEGRLPARMEVDWVRVYQRVGSGETPSTVEAAVEAGPPGKTQRRWPVRR